MLLWGNEEAFLALLPTYSQETAMLRMNAVLEPGIFPARVYMHRLYASYISYMSLYHDFICIVYTHRTKAEGGGIFTPADSLHSCVPAEKGPYFGFQVYIFRGVVNYIVVPCVRIRQMQMHVMLAVLKENSDTNRGTNLTSRKSGGNRTDSPILKYG
eukprot:1189995-Prorocentrum_minimum.AAC.1